MKKFLLLCLLTSPIAASLRLVHVDVQSQITENNLSTIHGVEHDITVDAGPLSCDLSDEVKDNFALTIELLTKSRELSVCVNLLKNKTTGVPIVLQTKTVTLNNDRGTEITFDGYYQDTWYNFFKKIAYAVRVSVHEPGTDRQALSLRTDSTQKKQSGIN